MPDGLQDQQQRHLELDDGEEGTTNSESKVPASAAKTKHAMVFSCLGAIPLVLVGSLSLATTIPSVSWFTFVL